MQDLNKDKIPSDKQKGTILITGASGNLGRSIVEELHNHGFSILATIGAEKEINTFDHLANVKSHIVNVLDVANVDAFLTANADAKIETAILLIGGFAQGHLRDTDLTTMDKMYQLNFVSAFNIVKPLLTQFEKQGGGHFIFVGARPAINVEEGKNLFAYAVSKNMVFKMAEIINADGKDKNISATVIVPGTIDTPLNRSAMPDADPTKWITPEAIGRAVTFVLSDTGKTLHEPIFKLYNKS